MPEYQVRPDTHFHQNLDDYEVMCGDKRNSKRHNKYGSWFRVHGRESNGELRLCISGRHSKRHARPAKIQSGAVGPFVIIGPVGCTLLKSRHWAWGGNKGIKRPAWFQSQIYSPPEKLPSGAKYGGLPMSGWGYKVFWFNGQTDPEILTPECAIRALPTDKKLRKHSVGRVIDQPMEPAFYIGGSN